MKRRDFLKSSLPLAAAMHAGGHDLLVQAEAHGAETQSGDGYDLVVIGGSLAGCFAAWHAARQGLRVQLIERRTFLATEITATMRPWLKREGYAALPGELRDLLLPEAERNEVGVPFDAEKPSTDFADDIPLFMGSVKKQFMRVLLRNRVDVLLGTGVWGVLTDKKRQVATGVATASKFGLQMIRARRIIDARRRTASSSQPGGSVAYSLELYGVARDVGSEIAVPKSLGLTGSKVYVHRGKRKPGQCFVEFRFVPTQEDVEEEARHRTEQVCSHLIQKQKPFAKASVRQMAWGALRVAGNTAAVPASTYANYSHLPSEASFDLSCQDVIDAHQAARSRTDKLCGQPAIQAEPAFIDCASGRIPLRECQVSPVEDLRPNNAVRQITFPYARYLPTERRADVVVAGGGTGGAMAALGSIREGAKTVTVEYLSELGGTSTLGRVTGYYWGHKKTKFFDFIEEGVKKQGRLAGRCTKGVARMLHYRKQATQAGGTLLTGAIVCGAVQDKQRVTGLVVERDGRLFTIGGDVIVDATGDGDVAALAGADYEIGNRRMLCTQNYSQWDVNPGMSAWKDSSTNRDYDILWNQQPSEWQRGYQFSHQQAHYYDFTPFMTVRESRRIKGDYTITLKDVALQRSHKDTICLAQSDYDPHFFGDTVFTRVGCLLPHGISAFVEIPYRAIVPKGVDNLLVSAKAISQTHTALQFTRMSFDIMTLGYVTGRIAATVAKLGIRPREFDVSPLQNELRKWNILPPLPTAKSNGEASVEQCIDELIADKPNSLLRIMLHDSRAAKPALLAAYKAAQRKNQQLLLAKALAWFGNPVGRQLIANEMNSLREEERLAGKLPREYYREDKTTPYWTINQEIALLALAGDPAALAEILALADSLELGHPPVTQATAYTRGRIDLRLIPFYNRIIVICFAIERMPHRRAVGTLTRFLDDRFIRGHVSKQPNEAGDKVSGGILESRLASTLARCGEKRGFTLLVEYLADVHPMLAHYASQQLVALLGVDHGYDSGKWLAQIEGMAFPRAPVPCREDAIEL